MSEKIINKYPDAKTLRFKLEPVGKTEEHFVANRFLEQDKERADSYKKVKGYMDRYYKDLIESVLSNFKFEGKSKADLDKYAGLYFKSDKPDKDIKALDDMETTLCADIAKAFDGDDRYKKLYKSEFIKDILPAYLTDPSEKETVAEFNHFTTYFKLKRCFKI